MTTGKKDPRIAVIKKLIQQKKITRFSQIFELQLMSKSEIAEMMGVSRVVLNSALENPKKFTLESVFKLQAALDLEVNQLYPLLYADYERQQK